MKLEEAERLADLVLKKEAVLRHRDRMTSQKRFDRCQDAIGKLANAIEAILGSK